MTDYPPPARPPRPGLHDSPQPGAHGLDARRAGGGTGRFRADGGLLRRTRPRRVGLIVTGGIAPTTRAVRSRVEPRSPPEAGAEHRVVTDAVHAEGRICLQILHFRRYAYHRDLVGPSPVRPDLALRAPRAHGRAGRSNDRGLRPVRSPGAGGRLRRHRGHGVRGLSDQRVHRGAPNHHPMSGVGPTRTDALPHRDRPARARAGGHELHHHLPTLDARPGRGRVDARRGQTVGQAIEAAGATIINTGIGWHEARIPTIATSVPRAGFTWVTKELMGTVGIPSSRRTGSTRPGGRAGARARSRRHGVHGQALPR